MMGHLVFGRYGREVQPLSATAHKARTWRAWFASLGRRHAH